MLAWCVAIMRAVSIASIMSAGSRASKAAARGGVADLGRVAGGPDAGEDGDQVVEEGEMRKDGHGMLPFWRVAMGRQYGMQV